MNLHNNEVGRKVRNKGVLLLSFKGKKNLIVRHVIAHFQINIEILQKRVFSLISTSCQYIKFGLGENKDFSNIL